MITPNIRQDLQIFPGTAMEDGSPSWMLYDGLTNKYFTLGLNAFRMLKHWIAGVESKLFIEEIEKKCGCICFSSNQVLIWQMLRLAEIDHNLRGYGKLLSKS